MNLLLRTLSTKTKTAVLVVSLLTAQVLGAATPFMPTQAYADSDNSNSKSDSSSAPAGNNGTLQVHDVTETDFKKDTDPYVCDFNFEAFDLDSGQTGNVTIVAQSPTSDNGTPDGNPLVLSLTTDANGDGATAYVNDANSTYTLADGHYKATLDDKFGTDSGDKAKSKVFWVDCGETAPVEPVTPGLTTQVSDTDLTLGDESSVSDTATLTGTAANGDVTGTVDFYVCDAAATNVDCVTDGVSVGWVTIGDGSKATSALFTPTEAGNYCFWVVYNPDETANYSTVSHTDSATECFTVSNPEAYGTITVNKVLFPATDLGVFNLSITGPTNFTKTDQGNGGTTGGVTVETGDYAVSETAGTATDMSNYDSTYSCDNGMSGTGTTVPAFTVTADEDVVCTFTNQRHVIPQVLGDSTTSTPVPPVKVTPAVLGATLTNTGLPVIAYVTAAMTLLGSAVFVITRRRPNLG